MRNVDIHATELQQMGITHYLNEAGQRRLQKAMDKYRRYTVGAREDVLGLIQDLAAQRADSSEFHHFTTPRVMFFDFAHRQNERMHISMPVMVYVGNTQRYEGKTIDISATGLQIKLPKALDMSTDNSLDIVFIGLQDDYPDFANKPVAYELVKQDSDADTVRAFLRIVQKKSQTIYIDFLEQYITGNKHRYKVNLSNTLEALRTKVCEQYFTPFFPSLPLFIEQNNGQFAVKYAMLNNNNSQILSYWRDEQMRQRMGDLVSDSRVRQLLAKQSDVREIYVYSFIHFRDNKVYFFSASQEEMSRQDSRDYYLSFATNRASFRVFKLQLSDMHPEQAHTPLSIPDSGHRFAKEFNSQLSARLLSQLNKLRFIVLVSDVTPSFTQELWFQRPLDRTALASLQKYAHPHNHLPKQAMITRYKDMDVRKNVRYVLRTQVIIETDTGEFEGMTDDFSVSGLRVELNCELPKTESGKVYVTLPTLNERTSQFDLTRMPYQIVRIHHNRYILHLRGSDVFHDTSYAFFSQLIAKNKKKLKADIMQEPVDGLNHGLRCIYAKNAMNIAFFINQHSVHFAPEFSVYNSGDGRLRHILSFFTQNDDFNLEFLYRDRNEISPMIQRCMQHIVIDEEPCEYEMFIAINRAAEHFNDAFKPFLTKDFANPNAAKTFIEMALQSGEFIAIKLYLQQTKEPDFATLQAELEYVEAHSKHHAQNIHQQLEAIVGFGYILDITDEVLFRCQFSQDVINHNQKALLESAIAS